jgi:hypothetical protein
MQANCSVAAVCIHRCSIDVSQIFCTRCCYPVVDLQELDVIKMLIQEGQAHLFANWPAPGACRIHTNQDRDWTHMQTAFISTSGRV